MLILISGISLSSIFHRCVAVGGRFCRALNFRQGRILLNERTAYIGSSFFEILSLYTIQLALIEQAVAVTCHCERNPALDDLLGHLLGNLYIILHIRYF